MAELVQATNHSVLHRFPHRYPSPISTYHLPFILSLPISTTRTAKSSKLPVSASSFNQTGSEHQILSPLGAKKELLTVKYEHVNGEFGEKSSKKQRVFFLDVNPLCYKNGSLSLQSFAHWISLFFSQVSLGDPVIAVFDGDGGNEYRRQILPSYKAKRRKLSALEGSSRSTPRRWQDPVMDTLKECNVPVVKIDGHEADDVVATFVEQVLRKGYRAVIASPDKDFKQLISEDVQIVMPLPDLDRWSFYTLKHYVAQYTCEPQCDLSLRCILGDEIDGIPGLQHVAPGFGRKTALKLLKKHGSLENLLSAASVRTVGKQYAQEALTTHADFLRRNYRVLSLRRDLDIYIEEQWLTNRDAKNDPEVLSSFANLLGKTDTKWRNPVYQVHCDSTTIYIPNLTARTKQECPVSCQFSIVHGNETPFSCFSRKYAKRKFSVPRFSLQVPRKETNLSQEFLLNLSVNEKVQKVEGSILFGSTILFSSLLWLAPGQVAVASEGVHANAMYEVGELFELGIQLSYLLLLLALLGAGSFFVIRQVLVRRELDLSAKELQEQVRSGDASATELFELGAVMLRRKFYPAAAKYLIQAIDKWDGDDQDLAQVYNALGVSYTLDGKNEKGIAQFENAVKLQPGYVTAWNNLGDAYEKANDLKSALRAFAEVLLFDPNNKIARPRRDALKEKVDMYRGVPVKTKKK